MHYPTSAVTETPTTRAVMLNKPDVHPLLSIEKGNEFLSGNGLPLEFHKTIIVLQYEGRNDNTS